MSEQPSLNIEGLARLDLQPDETLAVTYGAPGMTPTQCAEAQEWLTDWLAKRGQPVAGVLVLPQGSQLAAIRAPEPSAVNVNFEAGGYTDEQIADWLRAFGSRARRQLPKQF